MNHFVKAGIAIAFATSLTGCIVVGGNTVSASDWKAEQAKNAEYISSLTMGVDTTTVISDLGAPASSEAFVASGDEVRVLYYRTQHKRSDGETTKDETTPLVFVDGKLIGWGDAALNRIN